MSKENPWEKVKITNKNKSLYGAIAFIFALLVVASASNNNDHQTSSESNYSEPSESSVLACKSLISRKTSYNIDRLSYIGSNKGNPVVTYYVDPDLTHKFQCINGGVQLWAKGAGVWMSM
ncbi:TPA: hypothetical protein NJ727_004740 [Vibrio parahaemolyticus]|nr:hypothetical protein [Vibrio parahaemolyticus]HCG9795893.1 hypothetical protein [Vibrio parahaemolyticus]